jgi:two-component sensor histidine kinase
MSSYGYSSSNFDLAIMVEKELLDVDKALPIGLIVNEIVTNAFKYAYRNVEHPALAVSCTENGNNLVLSIKDNGNSWDETKWRKSNGSFGSQLVTTLCRQLRAKQSLVVDAGTSFTFIIPQKAQSA